jgi:hypothetical protein
MEIYVSQTSNSVLGRGEIHKDTRNGRVRIWFHASPASICLDPADAKELRDELNRLIPLAEAAADEMASCAGGEG